MDGERQGLPSASSFDRYQRCAGSLPLERLLRKRKELPADQDSDAASHGRLIHDLCDQAFFTEDNIDRKIYREEHLAEARTYIVAAKECALRAWGDDETCSFHFEKRLYLKHGDGVPYATGKPDLIMVNKNEGIVVDYKTGWGDLPPASKSWQLLSYAAMAAEEYGLTQVMIAFIHRGQLASEHTLDEPELFQLTQFALPGIVLGRDDNPFVGSDYSPDPDTCRYCRVKLKCPALNAQYLLMEPKGISKDVFIPSLSNQDLSKMKEQLAQLDTLSKSLDAEIRSRLQADPDGFEDWEMAPGRGRRTISDPAALCAQLIADGASPESIYAVLKLGVTDAEKLHKETTQLTGKRAKSDFNDRYGAHIEMTPGKDSLKRRRHEHLN